MAEEHTSDAEEIVAELKARVARERADGRYADADELAAITLEVPLGATRACSRAASTSAARRLAFRFRPELGFSSKPVVGPLITGVKKLNLRLLFFVFDDLARQTDAAVVRLEAALAAEAAAREALSEALDARGGVPPRRRERAAHALRASRRPGGTDEALVDVARGRREGFGKEPARFGARLFGLRLRSCRVRPGLRVVDPRGRSREDHIAMSSTEATPAQAIEPAETTAPELSVVMPCLDEARTLATCIRKAQASFERLGISGEVVVADNGSTDGSQAIAEELGARVVPVAQRGYGAALMGGIAAARGRWVIMGDADDSYDFSDLEPFVARLREGYDFVAGNRFKGGIQPGAMPWLHKWLGNPVLSFVSRRLYGTPCGDINCGLRAFDREKITALDIRSPGMEYAIEMIVKATIAAIPRHRGPDDALSGRGGPRASPQHMA